jgi:nitrite reductase (NADH) small subunit
MSETVHDWMPVCRVADIPALGARRVARASGPEVALFRTADGAVFALLDRCPHKGGPLSQGIVFGHQVSCPLHNWTLELASGQARAPDVGCAVRFDVQVTDGVVSLCRLQLHTRGLTAGATASAEPLPAG